MKRMWVTPLMEIFAQLGYDPDKAYRELLSDKAYHNTMGEYIWRPEQFLADKYPDVWAVFMARHLMTRS